ncbi:hypothetical protein BJ165DRAFT_1397536 [Panaeolus papilionaceus]|nr:hypothetical protein BJ165DRAFT_1397536 [Panaeolus papilionaceus]
MLGFVSTFQVVVVVMLCCKRVLSAPVPVFGVVYQSSSTTYESGGPSPQVLNWAVEGAARQIGLMRTTVESARQQDSASLQKLKDVFGEELNLNDIERTVDILDSGILRISSWQATFPDRNILAIANKAKHAVSIGREFYDDVVTPDWLRIGVLIHEATRLLAGTTDSWEWSDDSKTSVFPAARGSSNLLSGQWDNDYDLIKQKSPWSFHLNADTWFVLGYYLEHGSIPPHSPLAFSSLIPSTRRLKFIDMDQWGQASPELLTFGPSQWFVVIPNLG